MPSSHLILCHPIFLLPPIPPSIRVFSNESTLHMRWPKYWSFSFSFSHSNEKPGLITFRMDWLDLLAVQGTLKSLLQHHSSKASNFWCSAYFTVQLSHPYMTTEKTIALTSWQKLLLVHYQEWSDPVATFLNVFPCCSLVLWLNSFSGPQVPSKRHSSKRSSNPLLLFFKVAYFLLANPPIDIKLLHAC